MAHKRCPFCGGRQQQALPCEVWCERADGTEQPEVWFKVLCRCMAETAAGRTKLAAWRHWNIRRAG